LSANLLGNRIGIDQARALAAILKEHTTLKSLCGNRGDETELDMSGKEIGAEGAIMLAPEIVDNGAMTSLNLASNKLGQLVPPDGWRGPDVDGYYDGPNGEGTQTPPEGSKPKGIVALANVLPDMGALTKLDARSNNLGDDGEDALKKAAESR
jgi:hypothetical protein